jgi:hypothetical protein
VKVAKKKQARALTSEATQATKDGELPHRREDWRGSTRCCAPRQRNRHRVYGKSRPDNTHTHNLTHNSHPHSQSPTCITPSPAPVADCCEPPKLCEHDRGAMAHVTAVAQCALLREGLHLWCMWDSLVTSTCLLKKNKKSKNHSMATAVARSHGREAV